MTCQPPPPNPPARSQAAVAGNGAVGRRRGGLSHRGQRGLAHPAAGARAREASRRRRDPRVGPLGGVPPLAAAAAVGVRRAAGLAGGAGRSAGVARAVRGRLAPQGPGDRRAPVERVRDGAERAAGVARRDGAGAAVVRPGTQETTTKQKHPCHVPTLPTMSDTLFCSPKKLPANRIRSSGCSFQSAHTSTIQLHPHRKAEGRCLTHGGVHFIDVSLSHTHTHAYCIHEVGKHSISVWS